jgi:hypothetical protein
MSASPVDDVGGAESNDYGARKLLGRLQVCDGSGFRRSRRHACSAATELMPFAAVLCRQSTRRHSSQLVLQVPC